MIERRRRGTFWILGLLVALVVGLSVPVVAQEGAEAASEGETEEAAAEQTPGPTEFADVIVVTGTRTEGRSVTESMVPIDVIKVEDFVNQGDTDVSNLLRNVAPSYNVNMQPISDAATVVRPANLRNLAPDHTLVLVNNKRRHRAAVIYWLGNGVADGAQGADISAIPALALRQAEVLRDGASAQYGSDAIAGVMNFMLKDSSKGGSVELRSGTYAAGDGDMWSASANFGLPLGRNGFANFTVEYGGADATDRSVQRDDALRLIAAGNTFVRNPAQIWGSPEIEDDVKLWAHFGHLTEGGKQFYGHANYIAKTVTGGFFFRNPNTRDAVFSIDGGRTQLVGDLLDAQDGVLDGSAGCPVVRIIDDRPDPVALAQVFADPNCFTFRERFPGGFTPQFGGDVTDYSALFGLRGTTGGGLGWDVSVSSGFNEVDFFIFNTVNASLGPNTPTSFDPGLYAQEDLNFNFDITYPLNDRTNLAAGMEWRDEEFEIGIGQVESWVIGPLAAQGFSSASNGFPGFSDITAGVWGRSNWAIYGDVERSSGDGKWTLGLALRFEDFEDFGTTTNGKIAGRYRVNDRFQLRASASTGFRAPTPGQSNAFNVTTQFDTTLQELVNLGTIPSSSRVAQLRGGEPLTAEESVNLAFGGVYESGPFTLTVDFFQVDVSDRLAITSDFTLTEDEIEQLLREGITSARNLKSFRFFVNDFDSETRGVDVVATWRPRGKTDFSIVFNHTETDITKFNPATLDDRRIRQLREALPETRWLTTVNHRVGDKWRFLGRLSYYGGWHDVEDEQSYGDEYLVDLEAAYDIRDDVTIILGAQNVLDNFPDVNQIAGSVGNKYSQYSPFGFNGAYYYARVTYRFDWD